MMAAAGTAVHLGLGDRAVVVGESAVAKSDAMRADGSEARCTLALARCQVGEAEEALGLLLDVGLERPYPRAVHAIASAMVGDDLAALADADAVIADPSATYLDRILADVAAAAAAIRSGDDCDARERLARARAAAAEAGDVVACGLASCATETMLERGAPEGGIDPGLDPGSDPGSDGVGFDGVAAGEAAEPDLDDLDDFGAVEHRQEAFHIGPGWHRVIREMTGIEPHLGAAPVG
jgi:hypothetical protein